MDKRARQIRNKAQYRLEQIVKLEEQIGQAKHELALLEVEYEEITDDALLAADRKQLAEAPS